MTHECPKKLVPWLLATTPAGSQPRETPCPKSCCVDPVDVDPYFHELRYRVKQKLAGIRANTYGVSRARLHVRRKPTVYRSVHTRRQLHKFSHRLAAPSFSHLFSLPTHAMLPLMQRRVVARQRPAMVVDRMRVRTGHGGSSQPPLSTHSHNISFGSVLAGPPFVLERGAPVLQLHGHERGERGGTSLVHRRMIVPAALTSSDPRAAPFIASGSASKCAVLPGQQSVLGLDRASGTDVVGSRGSALSRHRQRVAPSHDRASGIDVVGSQGSAFSRNGGSASRARFSPDSGPCLASVVPSASTSSGSRAAPSAARRSTHFRVPGQRPFSPAAAHRSARLSPDGSPCWASIVPAASTSSDSGAAAYLAGGSAR